MIKKLLIILLINLSLFFISSCGIYSEYKIIEEVLSTCTTDGYVIYQKNGRTYKDLKLATGHDLEKKDFDELYYLYQCKKCDYFYKLEKNHIHNFSDNNNYLIIQKCLNCDYIGRINPTNEFKDKFIYFDIDNYVLEFNNIKEEVIKIINNLNNTSNLSDILNNVNNKMDELKLIFDEICKYYSKAEVDYYQNYIEDNIKRYQKIDSLRNDLENQIYNIEYLIYNSSLKELYFENEDLEEIGKFLSIYADDTIGKLSSEINKLGDETYYDNYTDTNKYKNGILNLINKRNTLANLCGYDNFYDYAYKEYYHRSYTNKEIEKYRNYVIRKIVPLYNFTLKELYNATSNDFDSFNYYYYDKCYDNPSILNTLSNYFKTMNSTKEQIDMFDTINQAIKSGVVFIGDENNGLDTAYTTGSGYNQNIVFFANTDYYLSSLTMVHEFGHFMIPEEYLNTIDFDLAETHSQSDEAMFVCYLLNHNLIKNKKYFEYIFLSTIYESIITTCMLDEFEEALYKNTSPLNKRYLDGISYDEYEYLIKDIEKKYNYTNGLNNWDYYFCTSSCYEISYGLSQVPCLGLYALARNDFDQAKETYLRLLNYYNQENINEEDNYIDILEKCGYMNPFSDDVYNLMDSLYAK